MPSGYIAVWVILDYTNHGQRQNLTHCLAEYFGFRMRKNLSSKIKKNLKTAKNTEKDVKKIQGFFLDMPHAYYTEKLIIDKMTISVIHCSNILSNF